MGLPLRSIDDIVNNAAAVAQGIAPQLTDLSDGSIFLALLYALGSDSMVIQQALLTVMGHSRLATCSGADVDSFVNDFGLSRQPGTVSSGNVTFSRYSTTIVATIAPGALVKTGDGTQVFQVVADSSNAAWNGSAYVIGSGIASITVPVQAVTVGSGGNVQANTITQIATSLAGVDAVTNSVGFLNGQDGETDTALKLRFARWLNSRSLATKDAIAFAIDSTQVGLSYSINENTSLAHPAGVPVTQYGFVSIWVDDGTGNISDARLAAIRTAVDAVRPISIQVDVERASVVNVSATLTVIPAPGYLWSVVAPAAQAAVSDYINGLGVGETLSYYRLAQVAQDAIEGIERIDALTLNTGTANITTKPWETVHTGGSYGTVVVS